MTEKFPIVPHESAGVDCCGCIIPVVEGSNTELRCNECGAVVGVINTGILDDFLFLINRMSARS